LRMVVLGGRGTEGSADNQCVTRGFGKSGWAMAIGNR
jgi:hypothetical protein